MKKHCTRCGVGKALDAFSPRAAARDGRASHCKSCACAAQRARVKANPEKKAAAWAKWYAKSAEQVRAKARTRYAMDEASQRARSLERYRANPERYNGERYKAVREIWRQDNVPRMRAQNAKRRAAKLSAQPAWANAFFISEAYDIAHTRSRVTGFAWHVDHMVPLQSKTVCGLHTDANLQVIPAVENFKKKNTIWPDMWEQS